MGNGNNKEYKIDNKKTEKQDLNRQQLVLNYIDSQFEYLSKYKDEEEIFSIKNIDNTLKNLLVVVKQTFSHELKKDILKLACKHNIEEFFVPLLNFCIMYVHENFSELFEYKKHEISTELWKAAKLLVLCLSFMDYLLNHPTILTQKFHKNNFTKVLLRFLSDQEFLKNSISFAESGNNYKYSIKEDFSEMLMSSLYNMSKVAHLFPKDFENLEVKKVVFCYISYVKSMKRNDKIPRAFNVLVNVLNEQDYAIIPETNFIIESLIKRLRFIAKLISNSRNIDRRYSIIDPIHELEDDVTFITDKSDYEWNSIEILDDLYQLLVHDSLKFKIYDKYDAKNILSKIIMGNSTETEKIFSIKLLWQCVFDENCLLDFSKNQKLIEYIKNISTDKRITNSILKMKCYGLLFMLKRKDVLKKSNSQAEGIFRLHSEDHSKNIMISYNNESQDTVLKIKEWLENSSYVVVLNPESVYETRDFEVTIKSLEEMYCVIVCLNEQYKDSNMCRTEAEHIIKMGKNCVPIVAQAHFKLDGWLYQLFSGKESIDFTNSQFDVSMKHLIKEIEKFRFVQQMLTNNINLDLISDECSLKFASELVTEAHLQQTEPELEISTIKNESKDDVTIINTKLYTIKEIPFIDSEFVDTDDFNKNPLEWNNSDLSEWVQKQKFCESIVKFLKHFNGQILKQLYLVKLEAPEYFYKLISDNSKIAFEDVAQFVIKLNELFN